MANLASKLVWGGEAVDYDERINFTHMRDARLSRAKAALKRNRLAACLLTYPENIRYVTSTRSVEFLPQIRYVLAFAEHDPILFEPSGKTMGNCPWIKPENVRLAYQWAVCSPGKEATIYSAKKFAESLKSALKEKGIEKELIGLDCLDEPGRESLKEAGITCTNAMPAMLEARAVKTEDEIKCFKMAANIADVGWYALYEALKPGMRERELSAIAISAMIKAGAESVWGVLVQTGGALPSSDKIIQVGDVVTTDFAKITYMGYNTCYYRDILVGRKPTQLEKDLHKWKYERLYKVIDAIKPGVSTADVAKHWKTAAEKGRPSEEYVWCDDTGHGLGLGLYEYPIINRLWSLNYPQKIESGMTLAVEAMELNQNVGRTKLEEMILVTDSGAEVVTRMPIEQLIVASPITVAE